MIDKGNIAQYTNVDRKIVLALKARASLIPENIKQSWYEMAAKYFLYFDHCAGYWPFEEVLCHILQETLYSPRRKILLIEVQPLAEDNTKDNDNGVQVVTDEIDKEIACPQALKKRNTKNLPKKHNLSRHMMV
ncbi:4604_t:CDS:2 [Ambispora leptoticha]|uniref:4604_t:CDS:1 n=1 Tax=Ambispora leptoticha TaxID=144679 RepID=A0A9N8YRB5_9GLOM|nr:4604_t:CDS:2 [Ambispora leptoticha]